MSRDPMDRLWTAHAAEFRDSAGIAGHWPRAARLDPRILEFEADRRWWSLLDELGVALLVTREYEHLTVALHPAGGAGRATYFPVPHPSGLAVDRARRRVHLASTRNPNVLFELAPASEALPRGDAKAPADLRTAMIPLRSRFLPGCLYLHDLALTSEGLWGASPGCNAILRLDQVTGAAPAWWPRCVEGPEGPILSRNHLQLNSIAAGRRLRTSFFSASSDRILPQVPGDLDFPVEGRGVIFSAATREPVARGLTRPHSARLRGRTLWVANSGYGEVGTIRNGRLRPVARLPGWTRGLCFRGRVAFVGTSRIIPRFRGYAPGLDPDRSVCGVHAIDGSTGKRLASLVWPRGNQIFQVEWIPSGWSSGFPFHPDRSGCNDREEEERNLFYAFRVRS